MIFTAPPRLLQGSPPSFFGRKPNTPRGRLRIADEDGARRALASDGTLPPAATAGASIEHLARIALG